MAMDMKLGLRFFVTLYWSIFFISSISVEVDTMQNTELGVK